MNQSSFGNWNQEPFYPMVSYIVPCYNNEPFVKECINSIKAQRTAYPNIEIIFVDDGSIDGSYEQAKENISESDGQVLRLSKNTGVGHALNIGFSLAKGKYLCFFAADDVLLDPNKTVRQQNAMEETRCDLSYYLDWYQGETIETMRMTPSIWFYRYVPPVDYLLKHYLYMNNAMMYRYLLHNQPINSGSLMITREAYERFGEWNEQVLTTDYELLIRYCRDGAKFCQIKGAPMFYRMHKGQASHRDKEMRNGEKESRRLNL